MIRIRSGDTVTELAWTGENIPAARLLAQARGLAKNAGE